MKFKNIFYDESFNIVLSDLNPRLSGLLLIIGYSGLLLILISAFAILINQNFDINIKGKNVASLLLFGFGLVGFWVVNISSLLFLKNKNNKVGQIYNYFYLRDGIKTSKNYLYCQLWIGITFLISIALSLLMPASILLYIIAPEHL